MRWMVVLWLVVLIAGGIAGGGRGPAGKPGKVGGIVVVPLNGCGADPDGAPKPCG